MMFWLWGFPLYNVYFYSSKPIRSHRAGSSTGMWLLPRRYMQYMHDCLHVFYTCKWKINVHNTVMLLWYLYCTWNTCSLIYVLYTYTLVFTVVGVVGVGKEKAVQFMRACKSHSQSIDVLEQFRTWRNGTTTECQYIYACYYTQCYMYIQMYCTCTYPQSRYPSCTRVHTYMNTRRD